MAHVKAQGSSTNGRDSHGQRLGVKIYGGQKANVGQIIIRQRGTKYHPGINVGMGKDNTIFAKANGIVKFARKAGNRCYVNIE
jgi:large subunit ribosomal protein L27